MKRDDPRGLLKTLGEGGFAVIPAKAGIHFYAFCFSSGLLRIGERMKRRRVFTHTRKWIPAFAGMTIKSEEQNHLHASGGAIGDITSPGEHSSRPAKPHYLPHPE